MDKSAKVLVGIAAALALPFLVNEVAGRGFATAVATGNGNPEVWAAILRVNEPVVQQMVGMAAGFLLLGLGLWCLRATTACSAAHLRGV